MNMRSCLLLLVSPVILCAFVQGAWAQETDYAEPGKEIGRIRHAVSSAEKRLAILEKQFSVQGDPAEIEVLRRRYSDGEIQFLLGNYSSASLLFYDLVGNEKFRNGKEYSGALYMLAESLYQQGNLSSAKIYYRELLNLQDVYFRQALERYLEVCGKINELEGIDQYLAQARDRRGKLPPEIGYVYGKWLFGRVDLSPGERIERAKEVFTQVASSSSSLALQSQYYIGVLAVQEGDLKSAAKNFRRILAMPQTDPQHKRLLELANMALGRIYLEEGKYSQAIDRYQEVDYRSDNFADVLYEIAWTYVRKAKQEGIKEYEKANRACEKLLLVDPDSVLTPEARILQGHLLLKLGRYKESIAAYTSVIDTYKTVQGDIEKRLQEQNTQDLREIVETKTHSLNLASSLPPLAAKWAATQKSVSEAAKVTSDINMSKNSIVESQEIAQRLLDVLENRYLEVFPLHQEGVERAGAVDATIIQLQRDLLVAEEKILGPQRLAPIQEEMSQLRSERYVIEGRIRGLPKSESEIKARKARMNAQLDLVDKESHRLGVDVDSMFAVLSAIEKYVEDTKKTRSDRPDLEKSYREALKKEHSEADALQSQYMVLRKLMRNEKALLGLRGKGDAELRALYETIMSREKELTKKARVGLPAESLAFLSQIDRSREKIDSIRARSDLLKRQILEVVRRKAMIMRDRVLAESEKAKGYNHDVNEVATQAESLIGTIAYESLKRVRKQFYDLVLKADLGLVDAAWTRKQDKTKQIHGLAKKKNQEIKNLDNEFKEVLKNVD